MELCIFIKYKIELVGGTSGKEDRIFLNTKMLSLKTVYGLTLSAVCKPKIHFC
jgi:hypothetical protein